MFEEKIEAWAAGPVIRKLFDRHQGRRYITDAQLGNVENLSIEQKACVNWAIEKYGQMDGDTLSHLTHVEAPWKQARKGLKDDEHSNKEITVKSIQNYYSKLPNYSELDESEK